MSDISHTPERRATIPQTLLPHAPAFSAHADAGADARDERRIKTRPSFMQAMCSSMRGDATHVVEHARQC